MARGPVAGKIGLVRILVLTLLVAVTPFARAQSPVTLPSTAPTTQGIASVSADLGAGSGTVRLTVKPNTDDISLDWSTEATGVSKFRIERSEHDADDWNELITLARNKTNYADASIEGGKSYDYRVIAVDSTGKQIAISSVLTAKIPKTLLQAIKGNANLKIEDFENFNFWRESVNSLILDTLKFIPRLIVAIILFGIFWLIYRMIRRIILGSMSKAHVDPSIRDMLGTLIKWSIMGFGLVIACNQIGIEIAALLTGVSIIGLAIGLSAQETLSNFIAGVVIFWDKPFKVGDWIVIDSVFGKVQRVSFRSTRLLNLNGETIVFPNTFMLDSRVANHSTHPHLRVEVPIGIAYKESIDAARVALLQTAEGDPRICIHPPVQVVVASCGDSSVNLLLRLWISDASVEKTIFYEYLEKAKKALDAAHIEIPFPHMQLLLESTEAIKTLGGGKGQ